MSIVFEDRDIIVFDKPCGMLSQSDSKASGSALDILSEHTGGEVFLVHRLDKTTSGLMVFAKNPRSAAELSRQINGHTFVKKYLALVHSSPEEPSGEFEDLLFFDRQKNKSFVVKRERKGVKKARLTYTVKETRTDNGGQSLSLVSIVLHTGRTHQIRVQFASRGMPLVGDRRYGAADEAERIMLKSVFIEFNHPKTKERLSFRLEDEF